MNSEEKDDAKPPIFADTFGSNGGDDSQISSPETPTKEVVENRSEGGVRDLRRSFKKKIWLMHCQELWSVAVVSKGYLIKIVLQSLGNVLNVVVVV
ncbi:hypothetical protein Tco_1252391 [Tanacetum coccineum]